MFLANTRVLVTRSAHQAQDLARPLLELGADVICVPLIEIAPPSDPARLAAAARETYDWIVFTSANAVEAFAAYGVPDTAVAVVGTATEDCARRLGFRVALKPREFRGENLAAAFADEQVHGKRILFPRAAAARDVLPDELRRRGALVDAVEAYRNVVPQHAAPALQRALASAPNWVVFASPSAVENFVKLTTADQRRSKFASIGPVTSAALRKHAMAVTVEAEPHTAEGLVEVILKFERRT